MSGQSSHATAPYVFALLGFGDPEGTVQIPLREDQRPQTPATIYNAIASAYGELHGRLVTDGRFGPFLGAAQPLLNALLKRRADAIQSSNARTTFTALVDALLQDLDEVHTAVDKLLLKNPAERLKAALDAIDSIDPSLATAELSLPITIVGPAGVLKAIAAGLARERTKLVAASFADGMAKAGFTVVRDGNKLVALDTHKQPVGTYTIDDAGDPEFDSEALFVALGFPEDGTRSGDVSFSVNGHVTASAAV